MGKSNMKESIRFLKYIESLNDNYDEYITYVNNDDFNYIIKCCEIFYKCEYKCNKY